MTGFMGSCELVKRIKEIQTGDNGQKVDLKKFVKQQEELFESAFSKKENVHCLAKLESASQPAKIEAPKPEFKAFTLNLDVSSQK